MPGPVRIWVCRKYWPGRTPIMTGPGNGRLPIADSGSIPEAAGETWRAVSLALFKGGRGLPRGSSLARLLAAERDVPNRLDLPRLTCQQILVWANDHRRHTGEW